MRFQNLGGMMAAGIVVGLASCDKVEFPVIPVDEEFQSALAGANEVPPVTSTATGAIQLAVSLDTVLAFRVNVTGIDSTIWARIYAGGPGATGGDTIATLFVGAVSCRDANNRPINDASPTCRLAYTGQLGQGQIVPSQLAVPVSYGATPRARFDSVLALMRAGNVYVNVHTKRNPAGEVRGQISPP